MRQSAKKVIVAALIIGVFLLYSLTHMRSGLAASPPSTDTSGGAPTTTTASGPASSPGSDL